MDRQNLKKLWQSEEKKVLKGWDFSYLDNRWSHSPTTWDYDKIVRKFKSETDLLLDMGTGGGEYLLTLNHPYIQTFVTEGHLPNVELCKRTLSPLGITVKQVFEDDKLDFNDEFFDIIINRHESFNIEEVSRVLKPNGLFITQQVGRDNSIDLNSMILPEYKSLYPNQTLENQINIVKSTSFDVLFQAEEYPITRFYDIGAIVYYAKAIEWEFPNFSVEKHFSQLCNMHRKLEQQGYIESREHRFIIVAQKNNIQK